jgi:hypothetical protein
LVLTTARFPTRGRVADMGSGNPVSTDGAAEGPVQGLFTAPLFERFARDFRNPWILSNRYEGQMARKATAP